MLLNNENYKSLLIIPCRIEHMALNIYTAITLEKTKIILFKKIRIVAGSLPYKPKNLGIKISHGCREIAFCPVGYFNLSHPVYQRYIYIGWLRGTVGRTSVFDRRTFAVLRSTCS